MKFLRNPYFLIALIAVFGYWEVAFLKYSLQWDMLDVHLPFLYYLSECLHENEFPFWNPYLQLGYPFYADLQGTPYYPPALIIAKIFGFNLYVLHFYFLLHIILAGTGMFRLCKSLSLPKQAALICGICYALGGIFISNGQHLLIITAAAYIPFALGQFILLYKEPGIIKAILFALLLFLLLSGGYPFLSIIFCYLLIFLFVFMAAKMIFEKKHRILLQFILFNIFAVLIVLLLSLPLIISLKEVLPLISRGGGISLDYSLDGSYTFRSFLFFLLPFSLVKNSEFFGTDPAMINIYFGVIAFCFFIYSLSEKIEKPEYFFLITGVACLLISFGQELPFRGWLYTYLPLMKYFRFPALFRIFTVVSFIVIAGFGLNKFFNSPDENSRKKLLLTAVFLSLCFLAHLLSAFADSGIPSFSFFKKYVSLKEMLNSSSFHGHVILQVFIQLFFLSVFILILNKGSWQNLKKNIAFLIVADMFISAQMNINYTVTDPQLNPLEMQTGLNRQPKGFPVPGRKTMSETLNERIGVPAIWRNVNIFSKEPSVDAFSSFCLNNYVLFVEQHPAFSKEILKNPPIYLSDKVFSEKEIDRKIADSSLASKDIFVSEEDFLLLKETSFFSSLGDTCYFKKFGPNEFIASVKTSGPQILTLLQNNYKGWELSIDNNSVKHFSADFMFISVVVPAGEHTVTFEYKNQPVLTAFFISSVFLLIVLLILLFSFLKGKNFDSY